VRILVIGGYGNFGARICRALMRHPEYEVLAAARDPQTGARRAGLDGRVRGVRLDLDAADFATALGRLSPSIVIHCAGPFQWQDYRVSQASMAAGAHYIDLADGREFVAHFAGHLDSTARAVDVLAVSGASTLPALSSAVVDSLLARFRQLREISIVIAPGQQAPRGTATLAAVFSYAGRPFRLWRGGEWVTVHGWQDVVRQRIAGLGKRWAAACDVPDLELFPSRYAGVRTVEFRAALELAVEHAALWLAAGIRRVGIPLPIECCAGFLNGLSAFLDRFGSERGA
jgi:saccharopine dehydrogenase-like NADP-dependent oxidoreductase